MGGLATYCYYFYVLGIIFTGITTITYDTSVLSLGKTDIFPLLETNGSTLRVLKISQVPIASIDAILCAQRLEVLDLSWTLVDITTILHLYISQTHTRREGEGERERE